MSIMKYIVMSRENKYSGNGPDAKIEEIFIFSPEINHDEMLEALRGIRLPIGFSGKMWERKYSPSQGSYCISAGFITGKGICSGRSESIGVKSRPIEDTMLAQKSLGLIYRE